MGNISPERLRLARDLHDGVAQDLVALGYQLDMALAHEGANNESRRQIREARFRVDELMSTVRKEILNLRESVKEPLATRIENTLASLQSTARITFIGSEIHTETEIEDELFIIAIELVRNAISHARATLIEVDLYHLNNRICLEVRDDGIGGASLNTELHIGHFGLRGVAERVAAHNGLFYISYQQGTRATVLL